MNFNCQCGQKRDKEWHLVCAECWEKLPQNLRDELYDAYNEKQGSPRHIASIRACFQYLRSLSLPQRTP